MAIDHEHLLVDLSDPTPLNEYLALEVTLSRLSTAGPNYEAYLAKMDDLYKQLTETDRAYLDSRTEVKQTGWVC